MTKNCNCGRRVLSAARQETGLCWICAPINPKRDPLKRAKWTAAWKAAHPEKTRAYASAYRATHREKTRASVRKATRLKNGVLDPPDEIRHGICPICERVRKLCLDHEHATGLMRGWVCQWCNFCLGWYERHAENATLYLQSKI